MRFPSQCLLAGALLAGFAFMGCSERATETPPADATQQAPNSERIPPPQDSASVQVGSVQQVNASWDAVSQDIANRNYESAVRAWVAVDHAQRQAQLNEELRAEYARRAYEAQEALRQRAETDPKAREAYKALGRVMMGR